MLPAEKALLLSEVDTRADSVSAAGNTVRWNLLRAPFDPKTGAIAWQNPETEAFANKYAYFNLPDDAGVRQTGNQDAAALAPNPVEFVYSPCAKCSEVKYSTWGGKASRQRNHLRLRARSETLPNGEPPGQGRHTRRIV